MASLTIALPVALQGQLRRLAKTYDCDPSELACVAVAEMIAAHRRPRRALPARTSARRRVQVARTVAASRVSVPPVPSASDFETVWDGAKGRQGASLTRC